MSLKELSNPFPASDIEWRVGQCGTKKDGNPWAKVLAYVTNRAIMERLDQVCGPENWQNEYKEAPCGGVLCGISIYIKDRERWVTKWDGAANTKVIVSGTADEDTNIKGGLSASMKRAGSQWGIGRYLYSIDDGFARIVPQGTGGKQGKTKDNKIFYWLPPQLPTLALPVQVSQPDIAALLYTPEKPYNAAQKSIFDKAIREKDALALWALKSISSEDAYLALYGSFAPGAKTANKKVCQQLEPKGQSEWAELVTDVEKLIEAEDAMGLAEVNAEFGGLERSYLKARLGNEQYEKYKNLIAGVPSNEPD